VGNRAFTAALRVASPDLVNALDALWSETPEKRRGLFLAIQRYVARMSGRPTPFGLFAGVTTGTFGDRSRLEMPERAQWVRRTNIDMGFLSRVLEDYLRRADVRQAIPFRPNGGLYRVDDGWRYAEAVYSQGSRTYQLIAMDDTAPLRVALRAARDGATRNEVVATLADELGVGIDDGADYVDQLIDAQVLVADVEFPVTGDDPTEALITVLRSREATAPLAQSVAAAHETAKQSDDDAWGAVRDMSGDVAAALQEFGAPRSGAEILQVDLFKPSADICIGNRVIAAMKTGIAVLQRFGPAGAARAPQLEEFRQHFARRYGDGEVPLVEALDDDAGIGFPVGSSRLRDESPLLAGIGLGRQRTEEPVPWGTRQALLAKKLGEALQGGLDEVEFSEEELQRIDADAPPLPDSFSVLCSIAARSAEAIDRGDFRVLLKAAVGPSGAAFVARFCHGDKKLEQLVKEHIATEERRRRDAIFAEIVHVPRGRLGNFLRRPVLRRHELAYLGDPAVPAEDRIPIQDVLVSVDGDRIVLRSQSRGCEILPRLTSAHHYSVDREMPIYRFLGALQGQGFSSRLGWDWGPTKYSVPYMPRVVAGKCVLSRRRWNIAAEDRELLRQSAGRSLSAAVQELRERRRLPRFLVAEDGDNELPIDLDNALSAETLGDLLRKGTNSAVQELFPSPDELCVTGEGQGYVHELFVPFEAEAEQREPIEVTSPHRARAPQRARKFEPGTEWLFLKLYTGEARADRLLRDVVAPVVKWAKWERLIDRWFFLRYADPDHHLRLRFRGSADALYGPLRERLRREFEKPRNAGAVWSQQWDTYVPETQRYGGAEALAISEEIFEHDSELALALSKSAPAESRWMLAYAGIDRLLDAMGMTHEERLECVERQRERFFREFRADAATRQRLAARYREHRPTLMSLLEQARNWPEELRRFAPPFARAAGPTGECAAQLRALSRQGRVDVPLSELAASYAHRHVNRLLRSAQREHETVLYHFLAQSYRSWLALHARRPARAAQ
jgi:thiopeptide-type bacteriocin biosynthesis protein